MTQVFNYGRVICKSTSETFFMEAWALTIGYITEGNTSPPHVGH